MNEALKADLSYFRKSRPNLIINDVQASRYNPFAIAYIVPPTNSIFKVGPVAPKDQFLSSYFNDGIHYYFIAYEPVTENLLEEIRDFLKCGKQSRIAKLMSYLRGDNE